MATNEANIVVTYDNLEDSGENFRLFFFIAFFFIVWSFVEGYVEKWLGKVASALISILWLQNIVKVEVINKI